MTRRLTDEGADLWNRIHERTKELRSAGVPNFNSKAYAEFDDAAQKLGFKSAGSLIYYGNYDRADAKAERAAMKAERRAAKAKKAMNRYELGHFTTSDGTNSAKPAAYTNGSAKPAVIKPASAKERYKALIIQERTFVPADALLGTLLKVSPARVSHIRSELSAEDFVFEKVDNGFFVSPPKPKPVPVEEPSTAVVEAQLPLPATAVEPEAITVAGTLGDSAEVAFVVTESDLAGMIKKLAHIEALLAALPNILALLTDLYVQNGRHHEASSSEQRQLRALVAQLLQKWI